MDNEVFGKMTPYDLNLAVEGYNMRKDDEMQQLAWTAANIMNMLRSSKSGAITPGKLLGTKKDLSKEFYSKEDFDNFIKG